MSGRSGIEWFELNSSGALLQQGAITDPNYDVLFPTVAVDKNRNLAIGYTKVSASEAASVYVSARLGTDPAGTLRAPALIAPVVFAPPSNRRADSKCASCSRRRSDFESDISSPQSYGLRYRIPRVIMMAPTIALKKFSITIAFSSKLGSYSRIIFLISSSLNDENCLPVSRSGDSHPWALTI
jgi:hypothetical protein